MRQLLGLGFVVVLTAVAGCGSGNKAKAEKLAKELIESLNSIADGLESGNKVAVETALQKCESLSREMEKIKLTKAEDDAMDKKLLKDLQVVMEKMEVAIKNALTSGKWKPQELMDFANRMKNIGPKK
jgi:hypothetical protein